MMQKAYYISSLLTIASTLFFGTIVFIRGRGGKIAKAYFWMMIFIALWAAGMFNAITSKTAEDAFYWGKIMFVAAAFIPALYFRFILGLISLETKYRSWIFSGYILSFIMAGLMFTPYMFGGMVFSHNIYWHSGGKLFWLYAVYFIAYPALAHRIVKNNQQRLTDLAKRQLKYISIAAVFGFAGGASAFLPTYGIFLPLIESIAIFFIPFACSFITIATYTARLIDMELFRRRAIIFSALYSLVVGVFVFFIFAAQKMLQAKYNINKYTLPIIGLFLIAVLIRPLENLLVRLTDKFLYQKKYNYQKILEDASKGMLFITNADRLFKLIVRVLSKHMRVSNVAVYFYDKNTDSYTNRAMRAEKLDTVMEVRSNTTLIEWLKEKKTPLLYEDILNWIQKEAILPHKIVLKRTLEQLRVIMHSLKASVCVPAFIRNDLTGFLILGTKFSGENYTRDDISLLSTLSNSVAVAVENAFMYEELHKRIRRIADLYKEQHDLFIDTATAFSYAVDLRDDYSRQHTQRIIGYCMVIIRGLDKMNAGYSKAPEFLENLKVAALLHDVGKVATPDAIINKKGPLDPEERAIMQKHIDVAVNILRPIEDLKPVIRIIKYQHEHYDGTGYPEGLKTDEIPFSSRILAVANAYDAMTSDRPYRKAMSHQKAAERIKQASKKDFDPIIAEALLIGFEGIAPTNEEIRTIKGEFPPILY